MYTRSELSKQIIFSESFLLQGRPLDLGYESTGKGLEFVLTRDQVLACKPDLPNFGDYWLSVDYGYFGDLKGGPFCLVCEATASHSRSTQNPGILRVFTPDKKGFLRPSIGAEGLRQAANGLHHSFNIVLGDIRTRKKALCEPGFDFQKCSIGLTLIRTIGGR